MTQPSFTPKSLSSLRSLKRNNDREWFRARKDDYERHVRAPMVAVIERLALMERVYEGDADVDSNSLEVIVGRLRKKIGASLIDTVRGRGYRLATPIPR